jgi:hypothetical protein
VSAILALYPKLKLSDPRVVALVYALKQVDAVLWGLSEDIDHQVEGLDGRLQDIAVYAKIVMCMNRDRAALREQRHADAPPKPPAPTKPVIYIAGPYRGPSSWEIEENIRRAERLALDVWKLGAVGLCPHTNTRFYQGAAPDATWLDGDLELLRRCDGIIVTDDWQRSSGARAEVAFAQTQQIPVFLTLEDLAFWLNAAERG